MDGSSWKVLEEFETGIVNMKPHGKGGKTNKTTSDTNSLYKMVSFYVGKGTFYNKNISSQLILLICHY